MSDWMAIDPHLFTNRKFLRLKRALGCSEATALTGLFRLWSTAFDHAQDGDLSDWQDEEIDGYFGTPGAAKALRFAGFVDQEAQVHDWFDFGGRLYRERRGASERMSRSRSRNVTVTSPKRDGDVRARREESRRDEMREDLKPLADSPAALEGTIVDGFDDFWAAYPNKQGKVPARKHWNGMTPKDRASAIVVAQAMAYCVEQGWRAIEVCPYGSTFLNQRRWDEWSADGELRPPPGYGPSSDDQGRTAAAVVARVFAETQEES